jgi:hypothetical protein
MSTLEAAKTPNWEDDILLLIQKPYWIVKDPEGLGKRWIEDMQYWGKWDLSSYDDVKKRAPGIYNHLRSKSMPVTRNPDHYWPEEALELFRHWANNGYPRNKQDTQSAQSVGTVIPEPTDSPVSYRVRKDIMSMSREELVEYQSKLDDILYVQEVCFEGRRTKWQELGVLREFPLIENGTFITAVLIDDYRRILVFALPRSHVPLASSILEICRRADRLPNPLLEWLCQGSVGINIKVCRHSSNVPRGDLPAPPIR